MKNDIQLPFENFVSKNAHNCTYVTDFFEFWTFDFWLLVNLSKLKICQIKNENEVCWQKDVYESIRDNKSYCSNWYWKEALHHAACPKPFDSCF